MSCLIHKQHCAALYSNLQNMLITLYGSIYRRIELLNQWSLKSYIVLGQQTQLLLGNDEVSDLQLLHFYRNISFSEKKNVFYSCSSTLNKLDREDFDVSDEQRSITHLINFISPDSSNSRVRVAWRKYQMQCIQRKSRFCVSKQLGIWGCLIKKIIYHIF